MLRLNRWLLQQYLAPNTDGAGDGGGSGSGGNSGGNSGGGGQGGDPDPSKTGGGNPPPQDKGGEQGSERKFTQKDLDELAARVRSEEKRKQDKAIQDAKDAEAEKQRVEQGKFKELYETEKQKAADLQARADLADKYAKRINEIITSEVKGWPNEVKETDPGEEQLEARMTWVEKNRNLAKRLLALDSAPDGEHGDKGGNGKTPDPVKAYFGRTYVVPGAKK